mgnify:FL=1
MIVKWMQNIVTKGFVVYIITIIVCFQIWDIYKANSKNDYNYICSKKGNLFKSATPDSNVYIKVIHSKCINGESNG